MFELEPARSTTGAKARAFFAGCVAGFAAAALPLLAVLSRGGETQTVFPPAPYFLLALGVGLFIGLAVLAISTRQS